ncbi:ankyrin repeat-containing domain protein [Aspergillus karnatakaensis]|uniref:ankyrin repeat-containing domain protein n=1 Tax=Aspergillus karnatakaensis TaxID=1810916 RepID=UPI003CCCB333
MKFANLPVELILQILDYLPILDYYNLKLAGCRTITDLATQRTRRLSRAEYLNTIIKDDHELTGAGLQRSGLEILVQRGQPGLILTHINKYANLDKTQLAAFDCKASQKFEEDIGRAFQMGIHWAAFYGQKAIVELLLDYIHFRNRKWGWTMLHSAAVGNQVEMMHFLLQNGAYLNALDDWGRTPLGVARHYGSTEAEAALVELGAKSDLVYLLETREEDWVRIYMDTNSPRKEFQTVELRYISRRLVGRRAALHHYALYRQQRNSKKLSKSSIASSKRTAAVTALLHGFIALGVCIAADGGTIDSSIDINWGNALQIAVTHDNYGLVRSLLNRGADAAVAGHDESSPTMGVRAPPLQMAVAHKKHRALKALLDHGVDVNVQGHAKRTALHELVNSDFDSSDLQLLLQHGADINLPDRDGSTPLHCATIKNMADAVQELLSAGAAPNPRDSRQYTPLLCLCATYLSEEKEIASALSIANALIEAGADIHAIEKDGMTALHLALQVNPKCAALVEILVANGANIYERDNTGQTAIHHAVGGVSFDKDALLFLFKHGVSPDTKDNKGIPPIHTVLSEYHTERPSHWGSADESETTPPIALLLRHGADPNIKDNHGRTALHIEDTSLRAWKYLIQAGARIDERDNKGKTPLLHILSNLENSQKPDRAELCEVLLFHGADVNAQDDEGYTPLMYAVKLAVADCLDPVIKRIVELLLYHGARTDVRNNAGLSAYELCQNDTLRSMLLLDDCEKVREQFEVRFRGFEDADKCATGLTGEDGGSLAKEPCGIPVPCRTRS